MFDPKSDYIKGDQCNLASLLSSTLLDNSTFRDTPELPNAAYPGPKVFLSQSILVPLLLFLVYVLLSTPSQTLQIRTPDGSWRNWCKPKEGARKLHANTWLHWTHTSVPYKTAPLAVQTAYKNMAILLYSDYYMRSCYTWMFWLGSLHRLVVCESG